jgi:hypothetical protein
MRQENKVQRVRKRGLVADEALDLMELAEVTSIHGLVTEHSIDTKVFGRLPAFLRDH